VGISDNIQQADGPSAGEEQSPSTIAELFLKLDDPGKRRELEEYRIAYENRFGKTDMMKYYTCMRPREECNWLIEHDPQRYFDGLPPFLKAYFKGKVEIAARNGQLDDMPDGIIRLFLRGEMRLGKDDNGRGI